MHVHIQRSTDVAVSQQRRYGLHVHLVLDERGGERVSQAVELDAARQSYFLQDEAAVGAAVGARFGDVLGLGAHVIVRRADLAVGFQHGYHFAHKGYLAP